MKKLSPCKISVEHGIILVLVALVIGSLSLSVFFYDSLPSTIATHFNANGDANGFSSKAVGLFIFPALLGLLTILFILLPNIDPLKNNLMKFQKRFGMFMILLSAFFIVIQAQLISWNLGIKVSPNIIIPLSLGILFFYVGILLKHSKRNFFVGIRTPWTLSNDFVWDKTHHLGSILFKVCAIFSILSIIFKSTTLWFILTPIIISVVILFIYSYVLYTKEEKLNLSSKHKSKKLAKKK